MTKTIRIEGMMCAHCEASVKKALEALAFVENAEVSRDKGTAVVTISGTADETALQKAVEDADFTFLGIE